MQPRSALQITKERRVRHYSSQGVPRWQNKKKKKSIPGERVLPVTVGRRKQFKKIVLRAVIKTYRVTTHVMGGVLMGGYKKRKGGTKDGLLEYFMLL